MFDSALFDGAPVAGGGGGGASATAYTVLGWPTAPASDGLFTFVIALNGVASALGVVTLPSVAGISWNGGAVGAASTVSIASGALYGTGTVSFIAGTYSSVSLTHTGLGFSGNVTLPSVTAVGGGGGASVAQIISGLGSAVIPAVNTPGTVFDALNAARAAGFGVLKRVGTTVTLYGADNTTPVRVFLTDDPLTPTQRV